MFFAGYVFFFSPNLYQGKHIHGFNFDNLLLNQSMIFFLHVTNTDGTSLKSTQVLLHINFMYKFFIALERLHLVYIAILQN